MKKMISIFVTTISAMLSSAALTACDRQSSSGEVKQEQEQEQEERIASNYQKADGVFRIVTYNVGSFSKYLDNSIQMVARMLKELDPDVVGLNELDSVNTRHSVNQVEKLAEAMDGWNWHFARAMAYKGGAYGNGVITPDSVVSRYTVTLPKESGSEQRSLAVLETGNYIFGAAHLDHKSAEAQLIQVGVINQWAASRCSSSGKPVFFAGDMNAVPQSATLSAIKENWDLISPTENTYNSTSPSRCIDYIFHYKASAPVKVVGSRIPTVFDDADVTKASDHLPVFVDVKLK